MHASFFFSSRRRHTRCSRDWSSDVCFFFSSRRRHTRCSRDWSSDMCSSDLDWGRTVSVGIGAGIVYQGFSLYIAEPAIARLTGKLPDVSLFAPLAGNIHFLLISLTVAWTLAAFGEEFVYRGYLLTRIARVLGDTPRAWLAALVVTSIVFGVGHQYQGPSGMITAGLGGCAFGLLYLATGRNLWVSVIAHGTMDTVGVLLLFLGRHPGA